jgi:serine/threonine protein phosphatase PrpC
VRFRGALPFPSVEEHVSRNCPSVEIWERAVHISPSETTTTKMVPVDVSSKSVQGTSHPYEDRILVEEERGLYAVADGVTKSSQGSGGVAAETALALLREVFAGDLAVAVDVVHRRIFELKKSDRTVGETTLTAAHVGEDGTEVVNVGDSPAYLVRAGGLQILTNPDTSGQGFITQVVGYPERIKVHSAIVKLRRDDYLILASDGVAHVLNEGLIPIAAAAVYSSDLTEAIIEEAKGTPVEYDDDKSVIVIRVLEGEDNEPLPSYRRLR